MIKNNQSLRQIDIKRNYLSHPDGSVLITMGETKVICTAMIEEGVPFFLKGQNKGWLTAEYSMLPGSTERRKIRDSSRGRIDGRTQEIQRLIGRSLRAGIDLSKIGENTIWIDCDVIQADGGTRTAAITGGFIAMVDGVNKMFKEGRIKENPIKNYIAAISVGIVDGKYILDMEYEEDSRAEVDMNLVMSDDLEFIEIQGTGEQDTFNKRELIDILDLGEKGILELIEIEKKLLSELEIFKK